MSKKTALEEAKELAKQSEETPKNGKPKKSKDIVITKAKITKGDTLKVEYSTNGDTIVIDRKLLVHEDLVAAFEELVPHWCILTDSNVEKLADTPEGTQLTGRERIRVTGISIGGDNTGVIITCKKSVSQGNREIIVNTPFTEFEADYYPFSGKMSKAVQNCMKEVSEYLKGKCAKDPQQELELNEVEEDVA